MHCLFKHTCSFLLKKNFLCFVEYITNNSIIFILRLSLFLQKKIKRNSFLNAKLPYILHILSCFLRRIKYICAYVSCSLLIMFDTLFMSLTHGVYFLTSQCFFICLYLDSYIILLLWTQLFNILQTIKTQIGKPLEKGKVWNIKMG